MIIAIDGESASGKGTIARLLAEKINYAYLDTGLLYRATAYYANKRGVLDDLSLILEIASNLKLEDLNNEDLKTDKVAILASKVANIEEVRAALFNFQVDFSKNPNKFVEGNFQGAILDGRDIGTEICPDADLKLYIVASLEERAKRRYKELKDKDSDIEYENIYQSLKQRDNNDKSRKIGALKKASDAIEIDNTSLSIEMTLKKVYNYFLAIK